MSKTADFWEKKKQKDIQKAIMTARELGFLPYIRNPYKQLYSRLLDWGVIDGILRHSQGFTNVPVEFNNDWLKENNMEEYEKLMAFYENLDKTVEYEKRFISALRKAKLSSKGKDRVVYKDTKNKQAVSPTIERCDNTIKIIMSKLYKDGDFSEIDTSIDKKKQIAFIRRYLGLQNINIGSAGKKTQECINKAIRYGYINEVQSKEYIEGRGFKYNEKQFVYQYTEEEIIKKSLHYTTMTEFRKNNFNMWEDASRKGILDLMSAYCYHSSGRGGFNVNVPGLLYYIKSQGIYKIGITNLTIEQRFSHVWHKIEVIKTWFFENGQEARDEEKRILREFAYAKHDGEGIEGLGNTELFTHDVLLLDR